MIRLSRILLCYLTTLSLVLPTPSPVSQAEDFDLSDLPSTCRDCFTNIKSNLFKERIYDDYQAEKKNLLVSYMLALPITCGGLHTFYLGIDRTLFLVSILLTVICGEEVEENGVEKHKFPASIIFSFILYSFLFMSSHVNQANEKIFKNILKRHGYTIVRKVVPDQQYPQREGEYLARRVISTP